jgi:hypothetical protein
LIGKKEGEGIIQVFDRRSGCYNGFTQVSVTSSDSGKILNMSVCFDKNQHQY